MTTHFQKRIAKGDPEAFVQLYQEYGGRMLGYLTSRLGADDAADVMQEVFIRLYRHRRKLGKAKNPEAFVFLTTRNEAIRWATRNRKHRTTQSLVEETASPPQPKEDATNTLTELLTQVSDENREIIELKIFSRLTFATIGKLLGMPPATVATRYRRSILKLQSEIQSTDAESEKPESRQAKSKTT